MVHDEFNFTKFSQEGDEFEMIKLWVNLPSNFKMTSPRYQSFDEVDFSVIYQDNDKFKIKVIVGSFESTVSPVKTFTLIKIYEVNGSKNSKLDIPLSEGQQYVVFSIVRKIMD